MFSRIKRLVSKINDIVNPQVTIIPGITPVKYEEKQQSLSEVKRALFEDTLQNGIVSLHFDTRQNGVFVPDKFANMPELVLNYSYAYKINDFHFNDEEVIATLSFGGVPFRCIVPWSSVFRMTDHTAEKVYNFIDDEGNFFHSGQKVQKNLEKPKTKTHKFEVLVGGNSPRNDVKYEKPKLTLIQGGKD